MCEAIAFVFLKFVIALLLISGFLGVVTVNSPDGVFALREVFPILQQITKILFIYLFIFPLHISYLVICCYLHNLHIILPN